MRPGQGGTGGAGSGVRLVGRLRKGDCLHAHRAQGSMRLDLV